MKAIDCIARMSRQMQLEVAKTFALQPDERLMEAKTNKLQRQNINQAGCGSYNGQSKEVFATSATGNVINTEVTIRAPAAQPASITSAHCSGSSIASVPIQPTCIGQLRERDTQSDYTCVNLRQTEVES